MLCDKQQQRFRTRRIAYEKPVFTELIVDRELMVLACEVNPRLGNVVTQKSSERCTIKLRDVIANRARKLRLRQ